MEARLLKSKALLASSESAEVLSRLRDGLAVKAHHDAAEGNIAVGDVEVDLVGDLRALGGRSGLREEEEGGREDE